jgi:hypothetical protein
LHELVGVAGHVLIRAGHIQAELDWLIGLVWVLMLVLLPNNGRVSEWGNISQSKNSGERVVIEPVRLYFMESPGGESYYS